MAQKIEGMCGKLNCYVGDLGFCQGSAIVRQQTDAGNLSVDAARKWLEAAQSALEECEFPDSLQEAMKQLKDKFQI